QSHRAVSDPGCHSCTFIDRESDNPGPDQGPTRPDSAVPSQTSSDIRAALKGGNRTQRDVLGRNRAAWHAEGHSFEDLAPGRATFQVPPPLPGHGIAAQATPVSVGAWQYPGSLHGRSRRDWDAASKHGPGSGADFKGWLAGSVLLPVLPGGRAGLGAERRVRIRELRYVPQLDGTGVDAGQQLAVRAERHPVHAVGGGAGE